MYNEQLGRLAAQWGKVAKRLDQRAEHTGDKLLACLALDYQVLGETLAYYNTSREAIASLLRIWDDAYNHHTDVIYREERDTTFRRAISLVRRLAYPVHKVTWGKGPGCYGKDEQGTVWATFGIVGNGFETCAECGKQINRGWSRGRLGEEDYFCSEHVSYKPKH